MRRLRPTVVDVDLDAIAANVRALKPPDAELMAVVKADGYGHGAVEVAKAALRAGASWLGVALVEEGIHLREAGVDRAPILVLSEFPSGSEAEALEAGLTPTVYTDRGLTRLIDAAEARNVPVGAHVKVDTGMHRVGVWPPDRLVPFVFRLRDHGLGFEWLWTHFARADEDEATTREQMRRFVAASDALNDVGLVPRFRHAANSAATIRFPQTHLDLVRVGVALYGLAPGPGLGDGLSPALSWRSEVALVKRVPSGEGLSYGHRYRLSDESTIATVPVGYADGYPRRAEGAEVLVHGKRFPVAGTVTMDQILVDCGDEQVEAGDEVILIGARDDERVTADELAERSGTINYEIVSQIGPRVPREYTGG